MEMKQLKYFVEVARREHISDAALELNIAQSAISRQIAQLERIECDPFQEVAETSFLLQKVSNSYRKPLKFWTN